MSRRLRSVEFLENDVWRDSSVRILTLSYADAKSMELSRNCQIA